MFYLHQTALYLHIAVGSCALILFWVPVFTRKGNFNHKRFGRYFTSAMYLVGFSGICMSSLDLLAPLEMHAAGLELNPDEEESAIRQVREFGLFLFSLSVLVLVSTRHGWLTILYKEDRSALRHPVHVGLNALLVGIGILLLTLSINGGPILFGVFGVLEIISGSRNLQYIFRAELRPKEWWIAHLNGLIGSGIGAYTAFTVFGGRRFFEELFASNFESLSIFLWITPGIVGSVAISYLSRHYQHKFGGEWVNKRASIRSALFS